MILNSSHLSITAMVREFLNFQMITLFCFLTQIDQRIEGKSMLVEKHLKNSAGRVLLQSDVQMGQYDDAYKESMR